MSLAQCQAAFAPHDSEGTFAQMGGVSNIDWSKVFTWVTTYGAPLVLKVVKMVLPQLMSGGLTWANAIPIIEAILAELMPGTP